MDIRRLAQLVSIYRWPLFLAGILLMSISAQATMVYFATRPDAPRPETDYYAKAQRWDADQAVLAASAALGWQIAVDVPAGEQYLRGMARPVDLTIRDRDGQPLSGLTGDLVAVRPADSRLNDRGPLTELPHEPGRYRTLLRFPVPGLWELTVDAQSGGLSFAHVARVNLAGDAEADE